MNRFVWVVLGMLFAVTRAGAEVYIIEYGYQHVSQYTSSKELDPVLGVDPGNAVYDQTYPTAHNIAPVVVTGSGVMNTDTGEIILQPIQVESIIVSGSIGYLDWAQTLTGSFVGGVFTMVGPATVTSGTMICEDPDSGPCTGLGGVGAPPRPLLEAGILDVYIDTTPWDGDDSYSNVIPVTVDFDMLAPGGTAQYTSYDPFFPPHSYTVDIEVKSIAYLPVPAAAWLFGSGLIGLLGQGLIHRRKLRN